MPERNDLMPIQYLESQVSDGATWATPETLDQIITNSLGLRLDDQTFASEIYADIKQQTVDIEERWEDASVFINVVLMRPPRATSRSSLAGSTPSCRSILFERFICRGDRGEYVELAQSQSNASAWYFNQTRTSPPKMKRHSSC